MDRRAKPKKDKVAAKRSPVRKSPKGPLGKVRDLEKRLAEALQREAEASTREAESLEQQTAMGAILRVISSSPTDVQPVFTVMAASAKRLCHAADATIFQVDNGALRLVAHEGTVPLGPVGQFTVPLVPVSLTGRVTL